MQTCDLLLTHARLAESADTALAITQGRIVWTGADVTHWAATSALDCGGRWITPGLIDCHTHLVHAGHRATEFAMRLNGASYAEIAAAGGGIVSTVSATRAASADDLVAQALPRLDALIAEGVTRVEIKSGYGLDTQTELKMLRAARQLATLRPIHISTTFLGAHALPPEFKTNPDGYIDLVCGPMLDAIVAEGLADAVDVFCEHIGFTPAQTERVFQAAAAKGLPVKIHAEQLSNLNGAALAARYGALSADHVEYTDEAGVAAMAAAGTVAVLLPGAFYALQETHKPPIALFRKHGVPMAIATDCNPGTSPMTSLLLAMNMASTLFGLTTDETLAGVTTHAAKALGVEGGALAAKALGVEGGALAVGQPADLAIWSVDTLSELSYRIGFNPLWKRIFAGKETA
jgi:imidazolonepropionase